MNSVACIFLAIICTLSSVNAQTGSEIIQIDENQAATNTELVDETSDLSNKTQLSINNIELSSLEIFNWLDDYEKLLIVQYIKQHKPLLSILELQSIAQIPVDKIRRLIPFLRLDQPSQGFTLDKLFSNASNNTIVMRYGRTMEQQVGYIKTENKPAKYLGNQDKAYFAFRSQISGIYSLGFNMEKDPGELYWTKQSKTYVDYLSSHIALYKINKYVRALILGDYSVRFGQGLVIDNSYASAKSASLASIVKYGPLIKPFFSLQENNMMRGAAIQIEYKPKWQQTIFYSNHKIDANIIIDSSNAESESINQNFSSVLSSGFHRTASELLDRNKIRLELIGHNIHYRISKLDIGFNTLIQRSNLAAYKDLSRPDLRFVLVDKTQGLASIDYKSQYRNLSFYGELATQNLKQYALLQGMLVGLGKKADYMLLFREYSAGYSGLYSNAYSDKSKPRNETGLLQGFNWSISKKITALCYVDVWRHPWLSYQINLPVSGSEHSIRVTYTEKRKYLLYLQFVRRNTEEPLQIESNKWIFANQKMTARFHFEGKINPSITWRTRAEINKLKTYYGVKSGSMIYSDFLYKPIESQYSCNVRFVLFDIPDYANRIYAYENDLLYQFSIPAYSGKGSRLVFNYRMRFLKSFTGEFHIARSWFIDQKLIGSSNDAIHNNHKTDLKFQLRFVF